jgi:hypothetical protein
MHHRNYGVLICLASAAKQSPFVEQNKMIHRNADLETVSAMYYSSVIERPLLLFPGVLRFCFLGVKPRILGSSVGLRAA